MTLAANDKFKAEKTEVDQGLFLSAISSPRGNIAQHRLLQFSLATLTNYLLVLLIDIGHAHLHFSPLLTHQFKVHRRLVESLRG